jgi:hypothetical protein
MTFFPSHLTPELSRPAKRVRLEKIVRRCCQQVVKHRPCSPALPPRAEHATDRGFGACPRCWLLDATETEGNERSGATKPCSEATGDPMEGARTAYRSRSLKPAVLPKAEAGPDVHHYRLTRLCAAHVPGPPPVLPLATIQSVGQTGSQSSSRLPTTARLLAGCPPAHRRRANHLSTTLRPRPARRQSTVFALETGQALAKPGC